MPLFLKTWNKEKTLIISYSPFIPKLKKSEDGSKFITEGINGLWSKDRFIDLVMG
ncbi:MAG TPA: hypothetical protein VIM70_12035 [Clostridium sp.]|uniref:hypothetical protein n=1 Tax=Clostridium sp. TaxID=1506 RepID=UPI002F95D556